MSEQEGAPHHPRQPSFASLVEHAWGCLEESKLMTEIVLLQVYKQKVKHLLYEQQQIVAQLRIEAEARLEQVTSKAAASEQSLNTDKQCLQRQLNEQVSKTVACFDPHAHPSGPRQCPL